MNITITCYNLGYIFECFPKVFNTGSTHQQKFGSWERLYPQWAVDNSSLNAQAATKDRFRFKQRRIDADPAAPAETPAENAKPENEENAGKPPLPKNWFDSYKTNLNVSRSLFKDPYFGYLSNVKDFSKPKKVLTEEEKFYMTRLIARDVGFHVQNVLWELVSTELKALVKGISNSVIKIGDLVTIEFDPSSFTPVSSFIL
jgi:hypothetical protein